MPSNSSPNFKDKDIIPASEWNQEFASKVDATNGQATGLTLDGSPAASQADIATAIAGVSAAAPVQSVATRVGAVTLTHADLTDWAAATAGFGAGTTGVVTFNARVGSVALLSGDVTGALGFTPYSNANPTGFQTAAQVTTAVATETTARGTAVTAEATTRAAADTAEVTARAAAVTAEANARIAADALAIPKTALGLPFIVTAPITGLNYIVGANQVVGAQDPGWAPFINSVGDKATRFDPSNITLIQLAQRVTALQVALTAHGLIGQPPPPPNPPVIFNPTAQATPGVGSIVADGHTWTITSVATGANVQQDGVSLPGSAGSSAISYDTVAHVLYAQDAATSNWFTWDGIAAWTLFSAVTPPDPARLVTFRNWLAGMAGTHLLSGQFLPPDQHANQAMVDYTTATGDHPSMLGSGYWDDNDLTNSTAAVSTINPQLIAYWQAGGVVCLNMFFRNPNGNGAIYTSVSGSVNAQNCITPGTAEYIQLHGQYDQAIVGLRALQTAGVIPIYRPFLENRFNAFWWAVPFQFSQAQFITLWRQHKDYLVANGITNLIWVFAQEDAGSYPGDTYADFVTEDTYDNDVTATYKSLYDAEQLAHPNKMWAASEWGSGSPSAGGSVDMNAFCNNVKNIMPKMIYFQAWSGSTGKTPIDGWCIANNTNLVAFNNNAYHLPRSRLARPV